MKILVHFGNTPVELETNGFEETLDIDRLTSINYSNLYGEAVTISALLNKIGMLRADAERELSEKKLVRDVLEATLKKGWRREANVNGCRFTIDGEDIKLSEKALDEALLLNAEYQERSLEYIDAQKNFSVLDSLLWAVQDKSRKLNNILKPVTPQEFLNDLVEGEVNTYIIRKAGF